MEKINLTLEEFKEIYKNNENIEVVDIREDWELQQLKCNNIKAIPMSEFENKRDEIDFNKTLYIFCRTWWRSEKLTKLLRSEWKDVYNINWWIKAMYHDEYCFPKITIWNLNPEYIS